MTFGLQVSLFEYVVIMQAFHLLSKFALMFFVWIYELAISFFDKDFMYLAKLN